MAYQSLNAIRARAELPALLGLSQDAFEKAVWAERYYELAYESKIWFDMIRTRTVRNDITKQFDPFVGHTTVYGKTFTPNQLLFPIPQREVDNNRNLVQNPGF